MDLLNTLGRKTRRQYGYVRVDTSTEAADEASDNEVRQSKRRALKDGADRHKRAADEDSTATTKDLAKPHGRQGTAEASEIVARYGDACHVSLH